MVYAFRTSSDSASWNLLVFIAPTMKFLGLFLSVLVMTHASPFGDLPGDFQPVPVGGEKQIPNGLDLSAPLSGAFATVERVNSNPTSTWTASLYEDVWAGMTVRDMVNMCGTNLEGTLEGFEIPIKEDVIEVPEEFDARQKWPDGLHPIRDQKTCGSCWAFSASEVLSDRFAIGSDNKVNVVLSPQDLVSCDPYDKGCNGGQLPTVWHYLSKVGAVSDSCLPYSSGDGKDGKCRRQCVDGENFIKYRSSNFYKVGQKNTAVQAIMSEIYTNGPVQGAFKVYADFPNYKAGVYQQTSSDSLGGHAVKIVGWGKEKNVPYWLIANSWGDKWGENGYFKIRRGTNECGIEAEVYAGLADVTPM
mmetsp:Transcript_16265/g.28092  ORF Transcript_16265/g.28092 Transcript_16265/m.28092 type:complete len:360 (+) Transcript_16265:63-1142(+)